MALNADRNTPRAEGARRVGPLLAGVAVFGGALVMRNAAGYVTKGQTALGLVGIGVARERKTGGAGNGDASLVYEPGLWWFKNASAADLITIAELGEMCFAIDDEQVAKTNGTNTRSPAGFVEAVDDTLGVLVRLDEVALVQALAGLANPA
jgi:hypothetical protein